MGKFANCYEYNPSSDPLEGLTKDEREDLAYEYMEMWVDQEKFDDFAIAYESGDVHLMADMLVSSGAINSKGCYENAAGIEKIIERWARQWQRLSRREQDKRVNEAFKDVIVCECQECNATQFPNSYNFHIYEDDLRAKCWECGAKGKMKIYPFNSKS